MEPYLPVMHFLRTKLHCSTVPVKIKFAEKIYIIKSHVFARNSKVRLYFAVTLGQESVGHILRGFLCAKWGK